MFSIQKFLGHDEKFYDLLEASAQQADNSVHHLIALLGEAGAADSQQSLAEFADSRREDKQITQELTEEFSKTFITPLEREDIQALATALYKIPKTVEKIGERILICPEDLHGHNFRQAGRAARSGGRGGARDGEAIAQRHRHPDRPRDECGAANHRRRRRQTRARTVARSLSWRLHGETHHFSARSLRFARRK